MASNDDERFLATIRGSARVRVMNAAEPITRRRKKHTEYRFVGADDYWGTEDEIVAALRDADKRVAEYDRECEEAKRKKTTEERLTAIEAKLGMEG